MTVETESKSVVGIIYPPPEIRNIVDKTAAFVARNGPEFEIKIQENEKGNTKFNFLNRGDPYNAYYVHKIRDFKENSSSEVVASNESQAVISKAAETDGAAKTQEAEKPTLRKRLFDDPEVDILYPDPPPEFEFITDPPSISAQELDLVKLTAEFVARNGKPFLTSLMQKESKNYAFDFLKAKHSLFPYFTKLIEHYTKILVPSKQELSSIKAQAKDSKMLLKDVSRRAGFIKFCRRQRQQEIEFKERERIAFVQIDWHDFVICETINFDACDLSSVYPTPTTPDKVGSHVLMQERLETEKASQITVKTTKNSDTNTKSVENASTPKTTINNEMVHKIPEKTNKISNSHASSTADKNTSNSVINISMDKHESANPVSNDKEQSNPLKQVQTEEEVIIEQISVTQPPKAVNEDLIAKLPFSNTVKLTEKSFAKPSVIPSLSTSENIIIRKDYDPKASKVVQASSDTQGKYLISPITGEKILASKLHDHMRIGLLDPHWVEQRDRTIAEKREQEEVYAPGTAVSSTLKKLAERRTDIFGAGHQETYIGKKLHEEESKPKKLTLTDETPENTSSPSVSDAPSFQIPLQMLSQMNAAALPPSTATAPQPPLLPPPPPAFMTQPANPPPRQVPPFIPPPTPLLVAKHKQEVKPKDIPPPPAIKRIRIEAGPLVTFKVQVPNLTEKSEWCLNGQQVEITLPINDRVYDIKSRLNEILGMPIAKQKLQYNSVFIKDATTLEQNNFVPNCLLELQIKERGGRKK